MYTYIESLCLRSSFDDLRRRLIGVLLEILVEKLTELGDFVFEFSRSGPSLLGIEEVVRNVGARLRNVEVEHVVGLVLGLRELAVVDGVEDRTSVLQRAALT